MSFAACGPNRGCLSCKEKSNHEEKVAAVEEAETQAVETEDVVVVETVNEPTAAQEETPSEEPTVMTEESTEPQTETVKLEASAPIELEAKYQESTN